METGKQISPIVSTKAIRESHVDLAISDIKEKINQIELSIDELANQRTNLEGRINSYLHINIQDAESAEKLNKDEDPEPSLCLKAHELNGIVAMLDRIRRRIDDNASILSTTRQAFEG